MQVTNMLPLSAIIQPLADRTIVPQKTSPSQMTPQPGESIRYPADSSSILHSEGKVVAGEIYTVVGVVASQIITTTEKTGSLIATSIDNVSPL